MREYMINLEHKNKFSMSSKPASQMTIEKLIEEASKSINDLYLLIKRELAVRQLMDESTPAIYIKTEDLQIGIYYVLIDLAVSLRAAFVTENPFEKRFHLKNLLASISKGYKLLMNFGKQRKHSLWMQMEEDAKVLGDGELLDEYNQIKSKLELFGDTEIDQNLRNLTLHYDNDMIKVYYATVNLNSADNCNKKTCALFGLIQEMLLFSRKVDDNVKAKSGVYKPILYSPVKLDIKRNHRAVNMIINQQGKLQDVFKNILPRMLNGLDSMSDKDNRMEKIKNFIEMNAQLSCSVPEIQNIGVLINNEMLLLFMKLDLVAIVDAYLHSESDIEFAMNFRRVIVTKTSAIVHLYGYEKHEKDQSFWCLIKNMVPITNQPLIDEAGEIETLLSKLGNNKEEKTLRAIYVHLFDNSKHCGNINKALESVEQLDPVIHVGEVMLMLEVYKKITAFTRQLLDTLAKDSHEKNVENTQKIMDMADDMKRKIIGSVLPDDVKKSFVEQMEKFKSMMK